NDGFKVWEVQADDGASVRIGVGICWDQWYPECARVMALKGAEVLLYPTAIGSEPYDADLDTSRMWRRAMIGHAVSNCMPVIASNRIGAEGPDDAAQTFYGHSFISDEWGDLVEEFGAGEPGALVATLDLERAAKHRAGMGFFRDRRPQLYSRIAEDI
ncbi:MAG: nitrilase-related carbon-nitrogen hydrolase, partial [Pseudomonadota bacterium]